MMLGQEVIFPVGGGTLRGILVYSGPEFSLSHLFLMRADYWYREERQRFLTAPTWFLEYVKPGKYLVRTRTGYFCPPWVKPYEPHTAPAGDVPHSDSNADQEGQPSSAISVG